MGHSLAVKRSARLGEAVLGSKSQIVLRAARTIFLRHGFSASTTDMIQREAAVSKSTVYAHYPTKEALFIAVVEEECRTFSEKMRRIEFRPGGIKNALKVFARAYLDILLSPSGLALTRVIIGEASRFPVLASTFYLVGPNVVVLITMEYFRQAAAVGEIDLSLVGYETASKQFLSLIRSEPQIRSLTHPELQLAAKPIEEWIDSAVATFLKAYGCNVSI